MINSLTNIQSRWKTMNLRNLSWLIPAAARLTVLYLKVIRPWQLRWGATETELSRAMPGDEDVPVALVRCHSRRHRLRPASRHLSLDRPNRRDSRRLVYYDLLDNLARPSARQLLPEHQQIYTGQLIPMSPDGKYGAYVKEFKENEWILWNDQEGDTTWFWGLYPEGEHRTRLVTRVRMKYHWNSPAALFNLLIEFGDLPMMRKCLLGIKLDF